MVLEGVGSWSTLEGGRTDRRADVVWRRWMDGERTEREISCVSLPFIFRLSPAPLSGPSLRPLSPASLPCACACLCEARRVRGQLEVANLHGLAKVLRGVGEELPVPVGSIR